MKPNRSPQTNHHTKSESLCFFMTQRTKYLNKYIHAIPYHTTGESKNWN